MDASRRHDHTHRSLQTLFLQRVRSFAHRVADRIAPLPDSVPSQRRNGTEETGKCACLHKTWLKWICRILSSSAFAAGE